MFEDSSRPQVWNNLKDIPTFWVDFNSGKGMLDNGQYVESRIGPRRKSSNLTDILETALASGAERIMFTGSIPLAEQGQRHWLLVQTPGWIGLGHWMSTPVTGRFEHKNSGRRIEVRTAKEWFGNTPLNPAQARDAWIALKTMVAEAFDNTPLAQSPAGTGTNLWAASLPKNVDPVHVSEDIAEEIHATSGQHHLEHLVAGPYHSQHPDCLPLVDPEKTPRMERFAYVDGRFMYASLCREIGIGPGVRMNREQTFDLLQNDPYARARVYIEFTVPDTWNHVGIFAVQYQNARDGWYYPNRPGAKGRTWADSAEVSVAVRYGWRVDPIESVVFNTKVPSRDGSKQVNARPLDTFADRIKRAREWVSNDEIMDPIIRAAVAAALRAILIQTIGAFASRGRARTIVTDDPKTIPAQFQGDMRRQGKLWVYKQHQPMNKRAHSFYHPEFAAQVWARGRAKVLHAPMANKVTGGALAVDPSTLLGINGDAIYLTDLPQWALPVENGGADDGKAGRLRLQGYLEENMKVPATLEDRDRLRARSVRQGIDRAIDFFEFTPPQDDADFLPGDEEEQ
ncbi:hypothetical protein [Arthrobacter rhombi]|uniref:hypothetical protein n=1 Tax=Arthrobacter rhombi TaxID=71253 RepID=UPI003FD3B506